MKPVTLAIWDDKSLATNDLEIITKVTDLSAPDSSKSLLGFYLNYYQKESSSDDVFPFHSLIIYYKTELNAEFSTLCTFTSQINNNLPGNRQHKYLLASPIKNVKTVQIKISGKTRGEFSINDFGLIYRNYRDSSVQDHDED